MNNSAFTYDFAAQASPDRDQGFWLDGQRMSHAFCNALPCDVADLLDVAMAVYAADRRSARDYKGARTGLRHIHVRIGVRNLALWDGPEVAKSLHELLSWLSADAWTVDFAKREATPMPAESERFLFNLPPKQPAVVSLFSGGLDSLAGLAAHTEGEPIGTRVLVSGYTHDRLAYQQRMQVRNIKSVWDERSVGDRTEIRHVAVPFGIRKVKSCREEKSQRTRALVYLALGVSAAVQAHSDTLWVYENGVGALNLPINETQLGVDNYRGVQPRSLMMAEGLFALVLERPIRIKNPFLFHTKAEMCAALEPAGLLDSIQDTVSCDGFPQRIRSQPSQCGYCTSCILRRQALCASGLGRYDSDQAYRLNMAADHATWNNGKAYGLYAMRSQAHRLARCLAAEDPWSSLAATFPELARMQAELSTREGCVDELSTSFVRLYQTYVQEWDSFPARLRIAV